MSLEDLQAKLAGIAKAQAEARAAQYEIDLTTYIEIVEKLGLSNVVRIEVPYTQGLPTFAVARTPSPSIVKRYRDRTREKGPNGSAPDTAAAAEEAAAACLEYPAPDVYARMCAARSALGAQLGIAAIGLACGDEGKD